jgi:cytochrome c oxidase subunit 4
MTSTNTKNNYLKAFGALLALLVVTIGAGFIDLGALNLLFAMTIAVIKALIIVLFFMHLRDSERITWLFAFTGLAWLMIMLVLGMSDYVSRGWIRNNQSNVYIYPSKLPQP